MEMEDDEPRASRRRKRPFRRLRSPKSAKKSIKEQWERHAPRMEKIKDANYHDEDDLSLGDFSYSCMTPPADQDETKKISINKRAVSARDRSALSSLRFTNDMSTLRSNSRKSDTNSHPKSIKKQVLKKK